MPFKKPFEVLNFYLGPLSERYKNSPEIRPFVSNLLPLNSFALILKKRKMLTLKAMIAILALPLLAVANPIVKLLLLSRMCIITDDRDDCL